jgi:hypothetical protein
MQKDARIQKVSTTLALRELRAVRRLQRESVASPLVFVSERNASFTPKGIARMIERVAKKASLDIRAHAHMLRHGCGFALARAEHARHSGLAWPRVDQQYGNLHRLGTGPVRGLLAWQAPELITAFRDQAASKMVPIEQILYEDLEANGDSERAVEVSPPARQVHGLEQGGDPPALSARETSLTARTRFRDFWRD